MTLVGNVQLVAGGPEKRAAIFLHLHKEGIETHANPDFLYQSYKHYGIEQARELRSRAVLRAHGKRRTFVIETPIITAEAQNALLKTIEEPTGDTLFIFLVPSPETLLPTVRSRAQILTLGGQEGAPLIDGKKFLSATPATRLEMLKPLFLKGDEERRDFGAIITFLSSLERIVATVKPLQKTGIEAIYRSRKHVTDKGALVKPLLEQVALLVPRV